MLKPNILKENRKDYDFLFSIKVVVSQYLAEIRDIINYNDKLFDLRIRDEKILNHDDVLGLYDDALPFSAWNDTYNSIKLNSFEACRLWSGEDNSICRLTDGNVVDKLLEIHKDILSLSNIYKEQPKENQTVIDKCCIDSFTNPQMYNGFLALVAELEKWINTVVYFIDYLKNEEGITFVSNQSADEKTKALLFVESCEYIRHVQKWQNNLQSSIFDYLKNAMRWQGEPENLYKQLNNLNTKPELKSWRLKERMPLDVSLINSLWLSGWIDNNNISSYKNEELLQIIQMYYISLNDMVKSRQIDLSMPDNSFQGKYSSLVNSLGIDWKLNNNDYNKKHFYNSFKYGLTIQKKSRNFLTPPRSIFTYLAKQEKQILTGDGLLSCMSIIEQDPIYRMCFEDFDNWLITLCCDYCEYSGSSDATSRNAKYSLLNFVLPNISDVSDCNKYHIKQAVEFGQRKLDSMPNRLLRFKRPTTVDHSDNTNVNNQKLFNIITTVFELHWQELLKKEPGFKDFIIALLWYCKRLDPSKKNESFYICLYCFLEYSGLISQSEIEKTIKTITILEGTGYKQFDYSELETALEKESDIDLKKLKRDNEMWYHLLMQGEYLYKETLKNVYLQNDYSHCLIEYCKCVEDMVFERIWKPGKKIIEQCQKKGKKDIKTDDRTFTIGTLTYALFDRDHQRDDELCKMLYEKIRRNPRSSLESFFALLNLIEEFRESSRNATAHRTPVGSEKATTCREQVVKSKKIVSLIQKL